MTASRAARRPASRCRRGGPCSSRLPSKPSSTLYDGAMPAAVAASAAPIERLPERHRKTRAAHPASRPRRPGRRRRRRCACRRCRSTRRRRRRGRGVEMSATPTKRHSADVRQSTRRRRGCRSAGPRPLRRDVSRIAHDRESPTRYLARDEQTFQVPSSRTKFSSDSRWCRRSCRSGRSPSAVALSPSILIAVTSST